jgi:hypothetical protein
MEVNVQHQASAALLPGKTVPGTACAGASADTDPVRIIWITVMYRGSDKSLDRPTSRCILFDGENISFDASLLYIVLIFLQLW